MIVVHSQMDISPVTLVFADLIVEVVSHVTTQSSIEGLRCESGSAQWPIAQLFHTWIVPIGNDHPIPKVIAFGIHI
jgi:hypothetical protein